MGCELKLNSCCGVDLRRATVVVAKALVLLSGLPFVACLGLMARHGNFNEVSLRFLAFLAALFLGYLWLLFAVTGRRTPMLKVRN